MKSYGVIHFLKGGRTACGRPFHRGTMIGTADYQEVACQRCLTTRYYRMSRRGPTGELLNEIGCPCGGKGRGCPQYRMNQQPPYYVCRITRRPAFVPNDGGTAHDGMYG